MPTKEVREYISPLLQPPLNRLFIPCPRPDFLPETNGKSNKYQGPQIGTVSQYMKYLDNTNNINSDYKPTESISEKKSRKNDEKRSKHLKKLQKKIQKCIHFPF